MIKNDRINIYRTTGGLGGLPKESTEVLDVVLAAEPVVEVVYLETDLDDNQVNDDELKIDLGPLGHDGDERLGLVGQVVQLAVEDDDPLGDIQRLRDVLVDLFKTGLAPVDVGRLDKLRVEVELPAEKQQAPGEFERVFRVDGDPLAL